MHLPPLPDGAQADDVVVFGENSVDVVARVSDVPPLAGKQILSGLDSLPGGQGATAAVGCARLGVRTHYVGAVGADDWAKVVRGSLRAAGVRFTAIERPLARTRAAMVVVDGRGERTVYEYRDPGLALDNPAPVIAAAQTARILLVDATDLPTSIAAATAARVAGVRTVVDVDRVLPRIDALLAAIDVIIAPESFLCAWAGRLELESAMAQMAARFRPAAVVATRGHLGSLAWADGHLTTVPGYAIEPVDTTGAGDAFRAGVCAAWVLDGPSPELDVVLRFAGAAAALNCRAVGAQTALPAIDEVRALVTRGHDGRSKS